MGGCKTVANLIRSLDSDLNIKVPVVIHLDHGNTVEMCKNAIDSGFTSVMIDASSYSLDENIRMTKEVVDYAEKFTVTVEAELGSIGTDTNHYTKIDDAKIFVEETNVDSLAPAIGTVHGIYKGELNIDYDLIERLSNSLPIPLVMHGGSGLELDILKKCVECGINKINVNSDLQKVWYDAVKDFINNNESYDPRKVISSGVASMKEFIDKKINLLKDEK